MSVDLQAFINTARKIYEKIDQGIFDVSNEVSAHPVDATTPPGGGGGGGGTYTSISSHPVNTCACLVSSRPVNGQ